MDRRSSSDSSLSSEEENFELILLHVLAMKRRRKRESKQKRRMWVRPISQRRKQQGEYHNLCQELRLSDPDSHFTYLRMSKERFDSLLALVQSLYFCKVWELTLVN